MNTGDNFPRGHEEPRARHRPAEHPHRAGAQQVLQPLSHLRPPAAGCPDHSRVTVSDASPLPPTHKAVSLPASTSNPNFSSTVALVGLAALSFSTTTEPISADRIQRAAQVQVTQPDTGHPIPESGPRSQPGPAPHWAAGPSLHAGHCPHRRRRSYFPTPGTLCRISQGDRANPYPSAAQRTAPISGTPEARDRLQTPPRLWSSSARGLSRRWAFGVVEVLAPARVGGGPSSQLLLFPWVGAAGEDWRVVPPWPRSGDLPLGRIL